MKTLYLIFFLTGFSSFSQNNLLLLKIEKNQDLKIDKSKEYYLAIELDSNNIVLNSDSKLVYFSDFTDKHLFSYINRDSIRLKTFSNTETFNHENENGLKNSEVIKGNSKNMKKLMDIVINTPQLYKQKLKISYTIIHCNYCVGNIAKYDGDFIDYNGKIILVIDVLKLDNKYEIPKKNIYDIIKKIDFNIFL